MKSPFTWLDSVMSDRRLSPLARVVAYAICQFSSDDGKAWPSQPGIAAKAGTSERRVRESIKRLAAAGWLGVSRIPVGEKLPSGQRATRCRDVYQLSFPRDIPSGDIPSGDNPSGDKSSPSPRTSRPVDPGHSVRSLSLIRPVDQTNEKTTEKTGQLALESSSSSAKSKSRDPRRWSDEKVRAVATKYLEVLGAVTGRNLRSVTNIMKPVRRRLTTGTPDWQIICVPVLQSAINNRPMAELKNIAEVLLRDGEHAKAHPVHGTVGAKNWIDDAFLAADMLTLDERLTAIAQHYGLTDFILRTGAKLTEPNNES